MKVVNEKSCGIVIYCKHGKETEFLLLHYPEGHWDFPKGHIEEGESEKETALRELEEETGIRDARLHDNFREIIKYEFKWKDELIKKSVVFFLAEVELKEVIISHEHKNHDWKPYNEALQKVTFDNAKNILRKAREII